MRRVKSDVHYSHYEYFCIVWNQTWHFYSEIWPHVEAIPVLVFHEARGRKCLFTSISSCKWKDLFHCLISKFFVVLACCCPEVCNFFTIENVFHSTSTIAGQIHKLNCSSSVRPWIFYISWQLQGFRIQLSSGSGKYFPACVDARLRCSLSGLANSFQKIPRIVSK